MQENEKSGLVSFGAIFSIKKVDRDCIISPLANGSNKG